MKNIIKLIVFLFVLFLSKHCFSHMYEVEGVEILHPWSTESDDNGNANVYLTIANNTDTDISLTKISTEISSMYMIMSNEKMVKELIIPAQSIRSMDDFYVMLHGINKKLNIGNAFPAKLIFSSGMEIDIKFVIGESTTLDEAEESMKHEHHH